MAAEKKKAETKRITRRDVIKGAANNCTLTLQSSLADAMTAAEDDRDDEEILGHILDALMSLGERRGHQNALHDLDEAGLLE